jgi:nucleotide-binding universal stress UspA family protein
MTYDKPRRRRVVAGIDFSHTSIAAVRWVARWLLRDSGLTLAHILVVPELNGVLATRFPLPDSLLINARVGARRRLRELGQTLGVPDVAIEIREGKPADAIAEIARACKADLIVVGKHGDGAQPRGYTGRTADHLVRSAPAAILLANGALTEAPKTIVVPLTYSSITPFVIQWTRRIFEATDATIIAAHVVGAAVLSHVLSMSNVTKGEVPTAEQIDEIFREDRELWKRELEGAGIPADKIRAEVVFGEVSNAVLTCANRNGADMIVMGSHAGPVRRLLLGSAAGAVLRDADIPVLVVTEPDPFLEPEPVAASEGDESVSERRPVLSDSLR